MWLNGGCGDQVSRPLRTQLKKQIVRGWAAAVVSACLVPCPPDTPHSDQPVPPAAGRLLELVLLLERHWAEHRLTYPLVLLSAMAYRQGAAVLVEWWRWGV